MGSQPSSSPRSQACSWMPSCCKYTENQEYDQRDDQPGNRSNRHTMHGKRSSYRYGNNSIPNMQPVYVNEIHIHEDRNRIVHVIGQKTDGVVIFMNNPDKTECSKQINVTQRLNLLASSNKEENIKIEDCKSEIINNKPNSTANKLAIPVVQEIIESPNVLSIKKEYKMSSNPKSMMSAKEYKEHLKGHLNIIAPPQDQLSFYDNSNRSNEIK